MKKHIRVWHTFILPFILFPFFCSSNYAGEFLKVILPYFISLFFFISIYSLNTAGKNLIEYFYSLRISFNVFWSFLLPSPPAPRSTPTSLLSQLSLCPSQIIFKTWVRFVLTIFSCVCVVVGSHPLLHDWPVRD